MENLSIGTSGIQSPSSPLAKAVPHAPLFLNADEVRALLCGICRTTLHNWTSPSSPYYKPDFPEPIQLSDRFKVWDYAAVLAWVEQRKINGKRSTSHATRSKSDQLARRPAKQLHKGAK